MTAKAIVEFKEMVERHGFTFKCRQEDLKKASRGELWKMWNGLMSRRAECSLYYSTVESHTVGAYVGISLTLGDGSNYGISESVEKKKKAE